MELDFRREGEIEETLKASSTLAEFDTSCRRVEVELHGYMRATFDNGYHY